MDSFEFLKYNLSAKKEMQRFAEAKNAGILVASSGIFVFIFQIYNGTNTDLRNNMALFVAGIFLFSALIAAYSFLPQSRRKNQDNVLDFPHDSILYFDDVSNYTVEEFKNVVTASDRDVRITDDFIEQIVINSRIVRWKLKCFRTSATIFIFGLSLCMLALIYLGFC